ncbi:MAG TPA: hypothetical protein ENG87_05975 [Candidatus Pacearchaeota archaeon]|nr:hypothetical protein [Candidatus Pacearchaeota archaeon]
MSTKEESKKLTITQGALGVHVDAKDFNNLFEVMTILSLALGKVQQEQIDNSRIIFPNSDNINKGIVN